MLFVLTLLLVNVVPMSLHISLEGIIAKFSVSEIPNIERPFTINGVSLCFMTENFMARIRHKINLS